MPTRTSRLPGVFLAAALIAISQQPASAQLRRIRLSDAGDPQAVVVKNRALIHTTQLLPLADDGKSIAGNGVTEQFDRVLARLQTLLVSEGSSLGQVVKLNVYAASDAVARQVRRRISKRFEAQAPAIAVVVTPLPRSAALVAADAVAATTRRNCFRRVGGPLARAIVTPSRGRLIFVSGQAERQGNLAEATRATMQSLHRTLKFLEAEPRHVVQVKTFLQPMKDVAAVDRVISHLYEQGKTPPVTHVAWKARLIEIEMIAFVPYRENEKRAAAPVRFVTPPGMKSSPVFSRVTIVESGELIYTAGLYGPANVSPEAEVRGIFSKLQRIAKATGSDLRHLAKATYYVSDNPVSTALNKLRPNFYDPRRPPAASKAAVAGVGLSARGITLDMIAVPRKR